MSCSQLTFLVIETNIPCRKINVNVFLQNYYSIIAITDLPSLPATSPLEERDEDSIGKPGIP